MNKPRKDMNLSRRRHSLPPTSSLSAFSPELPQGSDIFKQALNDLYTNEPGHESLRANIGTAINGLTNIFEGNESDYVESEDEIDFAFEGDDVFYERRHSSPACLDNKGVANITLEVPRTRKERNPDVNTVQSKTSGKFQKDHFIKHGHWPTATTDASRRRMSCPNTEYKPGKKTEKKTAKVRKNKSTGNIRA